MYREEIWTDSSVCRTGKWLFTAYVPVYRNIWFWRWTWNLPGFGRRNRWIWPADPERYGWAGKGICIQRSEICLLISPIRCGLVFSVVIPGLFRKGWVWADQYLSDFNLTFFSDSFDRGSHLFSGLIQFIYTCRFYFTRKPFRISMRKDRKQVTFWKMLGKTGKNRKTG